VRRGLAHAGIRLQRDVRREHDCLARGSGFADASSSSDHYAYATPDRVEHGLRVRSRHTRPYSLARADVRQRVAHARELYSIVSE
jgi:hypothetical protein